MLVEFRTEPFVQAWISWIRARKIYLPLLSAQPISPQSLNGRRFVRFLIQNLVKMVKHYPAAGSRGERPTQSALRDLTSRRRCCQKRFPSSRTNRKRTISEATGKAL